MHRASLATTYACGFPEKLRHHGSRRHTFTQGMDVIPICTTHVIVLFQAFDETCRHSLLAIVKVHEPKHLASVVHLCTHVLEAPPQHHVFVEDQSFFLGDQLHRQEKKNTHTKKNNTKMGSQIPTNFLSFFLPRFCSILLNHLYHQSSDAFGKFRFLRRFRRHLPRRFRFPSEIPVAPRQIPRFLPSFRQPPSRFLIPSVILITLRIV